MNFVKIRRPENAPETQRPINRNLSIAGNMHLQFSIKQWSAWTPGIETQADWQEWASGQRQAEADGSPALKAMPPMLRRRLDRSGRIALHTAYECIGDRKDIPMIFASRNGETPRSVRLLQDIAKDELLSPTEFGLSVHNATGGMFTIARQDMASCSALAAGIETLPHALLEAFLQLREVPEILVVLYDDALPEAFSHYADQAQIPFACSLLLTPASADTVNFELSLQQIQNHSPREITDLPWHLQLVSLLTKQTSQLDFKGPNRHWHLARVNHAH